MGPDDDPECERFREDLSAFADETLPGRRWEQVGYHVAGCARCRAELADIRNLRSTLGTPGKRPGAAPLTLAQRLEGIAGEHVDAPLYMAGGARCALPSKRRVRSRRMFQSGMAAIVVLASVLAIAFLVAPESPVVINAIKEAREQYSLSSTAISVNESVGAVLLAHERGASFGRPQAQHSRSTLVSDPQRIPRATASAMLGGEPPTHSGNQRVWISAGEEGFHVTNVRLDEVAGEGTSLVVLDAKGNRFMSWFVPSSTCCESEDGPPWTFWKYSGMDQVAGRWAEVIEARDEHGHRVARWWVDFDDGIALWSERYDAAGSPTIISGFTELRVGEAHLAQDHAELVSMNPVSSSEAKGWCVGLAHCPGTLAGLPLVAHASSGAGAGAGKSMRLFYSDGFRNLSVVWQEGQLQDGIPVEDATPGFPEVGVWQSGNGIISVTTNASPGMLQEARAQLPGQAPWEPSVMQQIWQGLVRLTGIN